MEQRLQPAHMQVFIADLAETAPASTAIKGFHFSHLKPTARPASRASAGAWAAGDSRASSLRKTSSTLEAGSSAGPVISGTNQSILDAEPDLGRSASLPSISELESAVRGPDVIRAARRSVHEGPPARTASRQARKSVGSDSLRGRASLPCITKDPGNSMTSAALPQLAAPISGTHSNGITALPHSSNIDSVMIPIEAGKWDSGEVSSFQAATLDALLGRLPSNEVAAKIMESITEHESKIEATLEVERAAVAGPSPVVKPVVTDVGLDAAVLRDASGLTGHSDIVISLYQLKKGMMLPPSELPVRFHQEKIVPLGIVDASSTQGDANPLAPHWDAKSRQWKV